MKYVVKVDIKLSYIVDGNSVVEAENMALDLLEGDISCCYDEATLTEVIELED